MGQWYRLNYSWLVRFPGEQMLFAQQDESAYLQHGSWLLKTVVGATAMQSIVAYEPIVFDETTERDGLPVVDVDAVTSRVNRDATKLFSMTDRLLVHKTVPHKKTKEGKS